MPGNLFGKFIMKKMLCAIITSIIDEAKETEDYDTLKLHTNLLQQALVLIQQD